MTIYQFWAAAPTAEAAPMAPTYIVGGPDNDVITFIFTPGVTGFLTLQTECDAKASISR